MICHGQSLDGLLLVGRNLGSADGYLCLKEPDLRCRHVDRYFRESRLTLVGRRTFETDVKIDGRVGLSADAPRRLR